MIKNTETHYGGIAMSFHWLTAIVVIALFGLGLWMTDLSYQDAWYQEAPFIHKSVGISLFMLTLLRIVWALTNLKPLPPAGSPLWEQRIAVLVHRLLYVLLIVLMISGYFISTADGRGVSVFGWFEVPALPWAIEEQEDIAGEVHEILAFSLIGLMVLHAGAAFKHHFLSKDNTLRRMLPFFKVSE